MAVKHNFGPIRAPRKTPPGALSNGLPAPNSA